MKIFNKDIPFMSYQKYLVTLSLILTLAFVFFVYKHGLKFGIDFTGGIKLQYQLSQNPDIGQIDAALKDVISQRYTVLQMGTSEDKKISIDVEGSSQSIEGVSQKVTQALNKRFGDSYAQALGEKAVGPKAGEELRQTGQLALFVAWVLILIYLGFRFDFYFSPGAVIGLIHDLIITVGAFALSGREVSLTVLAALLTIIGYSVNDTIIVYDRIRENLNKHKNMPLEKLVDLSVNETLSRTIVTSLVVFFVVLVLFIMAQGEIKDFAFAMMIGVITGTYSSIFIASPAYLFLKKHGHRFGLGK